MNDIAATSIKPRRSSRLLSWTTIVGIAFMIAALGYMAREFHDIPAMQDVSIALLVMAGILAIVGGGAVLDLIVPPGDRHDRIRTHLGAWAHSAAAVILGVVMLVAWPSMKMLSILLLLEIVQAIRYLRIAVDRRNRDLYS